MRNTKPWHAEAIRMHAEGASISAISRHVGKTRTSVRAVVDDNYYESQLAIKRDMKRRQRAAVAEGRRPRKQIDRSGISSYMDKPAPVRVGITLPRVSLPDLPGELDAKPQIRLAPIPRVTVSPGAERWREAHRKMIRSGKIASPDLIGEMR